MHAHPLAGVTEILRPDGTPAPPGEMGEVVLTGLVNYAMPLIRYRVGDTARFATESCPCGRGMPVIEEIGGRLDDFVYTRERGFLGRLDPVLKGVRNIVESQTRAGIVGPVARTLRARAAFHCRRPASARKQPPRPGRAGHSSGV